MHFFRRHRLLSWYGDVGRNPGHKLCDFRPERQFPTWPFMGNKTIFLHHKCEKLLFYGSVHFSDVKLDDKLEKHQIQAALQ
jgi:hypothetical protein